ncbi:uncharacterized protein [Notamacropus eugenii]|uniref:uncharacterized protein n=1 Tax=Notamacropus eugenii TaxID=9315 RepID=UPI003B679A21
MAAQAALEAKSVGDLQKESRASLHSSVPQEKGLFSFVCLQLFGPLEQTARGARFAFVATDYFTKSVHAAPLQTCSPEETSRPILELVRRFGLPEGIFSTRQGSFILKLNKILKTALKIPRNLVVEYNPQTEGFLEVSKAFVRRLLSLVLTANPTDWDQHLDEVFFLQNRPSGYEEEEEKEDLSSQELELQETSSAPGENWPPFHCAPEAPKGPPDSQRDSPVKALRGKDVCLYCNRFPAEEDDDVFAVLQCDRCQVWAHDLCVRRKHGQAYQETNVRCRTCLLADEGAGPGPSSFSRALEAEESRASSM